MTDAREKPERHFHEAKCWSRYEPCAEHHAHTYWCGGGELSPECPEYQKDLEWRIGMLVKEALPALQEAAEERRRLGRPTRFDALLEEATRFRRIWR